MPSGLHDLGVQLLLLSGALLLAWALLADWVRQRVPSRRQRRCPKCWYDLSHTPGLRCSECGCEAKRERKLFKAKRRWWLAAFAMLLLLGSYALHVTPDVRARGWVAAVPTTALIVGLPWWVSEHPVYVPLDDLATQNQTVRSSWLREHRIAMLNDLLDRIVNDKLPYWQRWLSFHYALRSTKWNGLSRWDTAPEERAPLDASARVLLAMAQQWQGDQPVRDLRLAQAYWDRYFEYLVQYRTVWAEDVPYRINIRPIAPFTGRSYLRTVRITSNVSDSVHDRRVSPVSFCDSGWGPCHWGDSTLEIGLVDIDQQTIELTFEVIQRHRTGWDRITGNPIYDDQTLWTRQLTIPVDVVASPTEAIAPYDNAELADYLRDSLRPVMGSQSAPLRVAFAKNYYVRSANATLTSWPKGVALGIVIEVCAGDDVVLANTSWSSRSSLGIHQGGERLDLDGDRDRFNGRESNEGWTVRVRSDPALALRAMNATMYWDGEVVISLEELLKRR